MCLTYYSPSVHVMLFASVGRMLFWRAQAFKGVENIVNNWKTAIQSISRRKVSDQIFTERLEYVGSALPYNNSIHTCQPKNRGISQFPGK